MTVPEQIDHLANELDTLIYRYAIEYDLPLAAVIGTLEVKKQILINEQCQVLDSEE